MLASVAPKKVGITGLNGFVGYHLTQTIHLCQDEFELVPFARTAFDHEEALDHFVANCDVIVHLAALNRHPDAEYIYETNITLVAKLIASLERTNSAAHILITSSTQEARDEAYGRSKKQGRNLLSQWAFKSGGRLSGLIVPNVFGPFGKPFYNSVVATFCHQITRGESPVVQVDNDLKLLYVGELISVIVEAIRKEDDTHEYMVAHSGEAKVSELKDLLEQYKTVYQENGKIPELKSNFELNLFNTFRSYIEIAAYFPVKLVRNDDARGSFTEIIRLGIGGQVSFSTTVPGITRGNHFHTRKIERFAVIKGEARIQLRQVGSAEIFEFYLNGEQPAYVDMPIWFTHNIKNIGQDTLYTIFWINEPYDPEDADTWGEGV